MNTDFGLVSIIMPLYNYSMFLERSVTSVLKQTYKNWELIIVDDCSTDDSFSHACKLASKDERIHVFSTDKNSGTSVARNLALENARGVYIAFLDADDEYDPIYLESQLSKLITDGGDIVVGSYRRKAPQTTTDFIVPSLIDFKTVLKGNPMSTLCTLYRFDNFKNLRFLKEMKKCEDYVFFMTMLKKGAMVSINKNVIATVNIHNGSKSKQKFKLIKWQLLSYKKVGIPPIKRFYYLVCWAIYGLKKYRNVK